MGGSASSSPVVQKSLANFMDAMSGGLNSQPALDQYSKQFRDMPDAAIRGVGDAVASIPDMAIAAGKLAMEGGFNPRMGQSERVKRFADTTYMPINPMMQDALTRAGVAETEGGNNLTRFVSGAMAPYAMGKYAGAVGDAIGAAERGALSNAERGMVKLADDLPMDEASRMARADEMGFDMGRILYHNTDKLEENGDALYDLRRSKRGMIGPGIYGSPNPKFAERYGDIKTGTNNTIPFVVKGKLAQISDIDNSSNEARLILAEDNKKIDMQEWKDLSNKLLKDKGFTGKEIRDQVVVFDPENVRSPYAKFDPAESKSNKLSAAGLPLSAFVGEKDDTPFDRLKRKFKGAK